MHTSTCACRTCYVARAELLQATWREAAPTIRRQILGIVTDAWKVYTPPDYLGMQN